MDEVNEFFDLSKPKQRIILRGPQTDGIPVVDEDFVSNLSESRYEGPSATPNLGSDYAIAYQERERKNYLERIPTMDEHDGGIDSLENLTSIGDMSLVADLTEETLTQVYNKYTFNKEVNPNLSINDVKNKILDAISAQNVTIIEGPTGCGKTTQVPQWILDHSYENRKHCNIIVTQPRRIAAISIAKRVCQERGWDLGGLVGYQVGLESKTTKDTRLQYVTTGILLQKLVSAQNMNEYSHIILDEIHERGQDMDFLLLIVRKFLYTNSRSVKVILMSATFNIQDFAQYFAASTPRGYEASAVISVQRKSPFVVKDFYLNQLDKLGALPDVRFEESTISDGTYNIAVKLIHAFENIDKNEHSVDESEDDTDDYTSPTVLVFLPGINEIEELYKKLTNTKARQEIATGSGQYNWLVLPLHSTITSDEQANVFHKAPPGFRKIILSTNIAESSITVPDIKYVIDFCLMKVLVADPLTNFTSLQLSWASKSNCKQRAGRTGRVCDGRVYRLVPDHFYEMLPEHCAPEIKRCPLDRLVLLSKMLKMGSPKSILALAMDPPDLSNIQRTVLTLKEVGGLLKTCDGELVPEDGDITYLGTIMAKLPVDVRISKLIVLGYIYGCLNECIIMGSGMSVKNIFNSPFQERLKAYNTKLTWADGSTSDCLAALNVYQVWQNLRQQQHFKTSRSGERGWAREAYVQLRALKEMDDLVREMRRRLAREGIEDTMGNIKSSWNRAEKPFILKLLLAGAFYPHYFVQPKGTDDYERDAVKTLAGCDPCNTIYLKTDSINNQPLEIYTKTIKYSLQNYITDDMKIKFDKNSSKIFISFVSCHMQDQRQRDAVMPGIPGRVVLPVYKAIKMRQLKLPIYINVLPQDKADAAYASLCAKSKDELNYLMPRLPDIEDTYIDVVISHIINCGNFWVQHVDKSSREELMRVNTEVNQPNLTPVNAKKIVRVGELYAAPYEDESTETRYYRAIIKLLLPQDMVWVFYLDYGNYARVRKSSLREVPHAHLDIAPFAFECVLSEIAPSILKDTRGIWSNDANVKFQQFTANKRLIAKVYSVAYGVVSVELLLENKLNVNEYLIQEGLAQYAEEGYQSKLNHDIRESAKTLQIAQIRALNKEQAQMCTQNYFESNSPNPKDCCQRITLKGPFSPLETSVFNLMLGSKDKKVGIEWSSVNSVLLDTNPQDPYERLLVAACVGQSQSGDRLTLRHTTLMPNIPGLLPIVSLIFCPTMEMRRDTTKTRYVSTLCGLGYDDNGRALFPEHDMLINVDVDLKNEDLDYINHLRYLMNIMLYRQDGQDEPLVDEKTKAMIPGKIREIISKLMLRQRKHREIIPVANAWRWNSAPQADVQEPDTSDMSQSSVFSLHSALTLYPVDQDKIKKLTAENEKLYAAVSRNSAMSSKHEMECTLCGTAPLPLHSLRIHLYSRIHKEKEADLAITNKSTTD